MAASLRSVQSVLLSVLVLLIGHGLQLTLLPLTAQSLGWSGTLIGLTGSAYYLGFIVGCLSASRIIRRAGHIRAFSSGVAVAAIAILAASIQQDFLSWLVLRFLTGCSLAGLYTIVESWLNERTSNEQRGAVLASYTAICLGAMAAGQLFLELDHFSLNQLFTVAAILLIAAIIPIGLTSSPQPETPDDIKFNWKIAYQASHVGMICASLSGVIVGLLWSMGAVYASQQTGSVETGARFVMLAILGGFFAQFPAGRLSDFLDRRYVIMILAAIGLTGAALPILDASNSEWILYTAAALCGAGSMPIYSISLAHANDNADGKFRLIASGMLIANAVGAIAGPLLFAGTNQLGLADGFMITIAVAFIGCIVWTGLRIRTHEVSREYFEPYQVLPKTTTEVMTLDPRLHEED
jgi:MFS family permease